MNLQDMINNYQGSGQDSIIPQIRSMMAKPILDDTSNAAATGVNLSDMMTNGINLRNASMKAYGDILKEDVANRMVGPTTIQHLAAAQKIANEANPEWARVNELNKKMGEVQGTAEGNRYTSDMMSDTPLHPNFAKTSGYSTWKDLVRDYGKDAPTMYNNWVRANAQKEVGEMQAATTDKQAKTISMEAANKLVVDARGKIISINKAIQELQILSMTPGDFGKKAKAQMDELNAQRDALNTEVSGAMETLRKLGVTTKEGSKPSPPSSATKRPGVKKDNARVDAGKVKVNGTIYDSYVKGGVQYIDIDGIPNKITKSK